MRAVVYARVSSLQQREKLTIESQLRVLPEFVASREWTLVRPADHYVDDGRSAKAGKLEKREAFLRLLEDAGKRLFDVVVVVDMDRITRSEDLIERGHVLGTFQRGGVKIAVASTGQIYDLSNSTGDLFSTLQAFFAAEENRKRRERTIRGHEQSARRGRKPRGRTPYGYFFDVATGRWSHDPVAAPVVREIFDRLAAGESAKKIGRDLESRGVASPSGGRWEGRIPVLAKKATYRGRFVTDGPRGLAVEVPPLVDESTWYAAQSSIAANAVKGLRQTKRIYLCEGIAVCSLCGSKIGIHAESLSRSRGRSPYYTCMQRRRPHPSRPRCSLPMRQTAEVDSRIWSSVAYEVCKPDFARRVLGLRASRAKDAELWVDDLRQYREQLDRLQTAESAILARFGDGLISEGAMDAEIKRLAAKRSLLKQQIETAEASAASARGTITLADHVASALDDLRARVASATPAERQAIVRSLIDGVGSSVVLFAPEGIRATMRIAVDPCTGDALKPQYATPGQGRKVFEFQLVA